MRIKQIVGIATASVGLVMGMAGGMVGAQSGAISDTGRHSINAVVDYSSSKVKVDNDNNLHVNNTSTQNASTGDAKVSGNKKSGGSATSGNASNSNSFSASLAVNNMGSNSALVPATSGNGAGTIDGTGSHSINVVVLASTSDVQVNNDNNLHVNNTSWQGASTGDATVSSNKSGGSATSGDASNSSSTSITFGVSN